MALKTARNEYVNCKSVEIGAKNSSRKDGRGGYVKMPVIPKAHPIHNHTRRLMFALNCQSKVE